MDSLQEAFIHPPGTVRVLYFKSFEQDPIVIPLFSPIVRLEGARTIFNITPIGFVWKKKVTYT